MKQSQKLAIRSSEIRSRLNEIAALETDKVTDDIRNEAESLRTELSTVETQFRAALSGEAEEERTAAGEFGNGDGEPAEVRALIGRVSIADYLGPASAGIGLTGVPVELASALSVPTTGKYGGIAVPWRMLELPEHRAKPESRAFTDTGDLAGAVAQRPILQRLFGPGILDALGVRIESVPSGRSEWPLITGGVVPAMKAEGTDADAAVAASFATETLKPKRLTGRYELTHEVSAQVSDMEARLRADLGDAVMSKMSDRVINGNETANPEDVDGFLTTISVPGDAGAVADYAAYAGAHAGAVDGIHAGMEGEVSSVIGVDVYKHAASVYQAGSGESGSEALKRRSTSCVSSVYVGSADGTSKQHKANIFHAAGPNGGAMRGDSIAAMWPTLEIVRDPYTKASTGVVLTWISLWDAQTAFRAGAYQRLAFKIGT